MLALDNNHRHESGHRKRLSIVVIIHIFSSSNESNLLILPLLDNNNYVDEGIIIGFFACYARRARATIRKSTRLPLFRSRPFLLASNSSFRCLHISYLHISSCLQYAHIQDHRLSVHTLKPTVLLQ